MYICNVICEGDSYCEYYFLIAAIYIIINLQCFEIAVVQIKLWKWNPTCCCMKLTLIGENVKNLLSPHRKKSYNNNNHEVFLFSSHHLEKWICSSNKYFIKCSVTEFKIKSDWRKSATLWNERFHFFCMFFFLRNTHTLHLIHILFSIQVNLRFVNV